MNFNCEKNTFRALSFFVFTVIALSGFNALAAAPVLTAPADGVTIDTHFRIKGPYNKLSRYTYLTSDKATRDGYIKYKSWGYFDETGTDLRFGDVDVQNNFAAPGQVTNVLQWTGSAPFSVVVSNINDHTEFFSVNGYNATSLPLQNFEIAKTYRWTVSNAEGSASREFTTSDLAPRLLADPACQVAGIRDLGGRIGYGGRRVRQNKIFRCSQFNDDVDSASAAPGASRVNSPVARDFWLKLGIKTDLDLRNAGERGSLSASPMNAVTGNTSIQKIPGAGPNYIESSKSSVKNEFLVFVNSANYPIAFHCVWGKDRTGVLASILLGVLGCDIEEIRKDWEATHFWTSRLGLNVNSAPNSFDNYETTMANYTGATYGEQCVNYLKSAGVTAAQIETFRELMLEPLEEEGEGEGEDPVLPEGWGYQINGLGASGNEVALVFTNTASARSWTIPDGVSSIRLLVVGGGGAGGAGTMCGSGPCGGGGGGAGGYVYNADYAVTAGTMYSITVGAGGNDANGGSSSFGSVTAAGGGKGGAKAAGANGASGGGGSGCHTVSSAQANYAGGTGTAGLGFAGGSGNAYWTKSSGCKCGTGGGGGGASAAGAAAPNDENGGAGGEGIANDITGASIVYCSGGGGGSDSARFSISDSHFRGLGGTGAGNGGGAVPDSATPITAGEDATGFGCGGGGGTGNGQVEVYGGGKGFQGVVIVRYVTSGETPQPPEEPEEPEVATFDCLETDGIGYILTDYIPNIGKTMIEIKARLLDTSRTHGLFVANASADGKSNQDTAQTVLSIDSLNWSSRFYNQPTGDDKRADLICTSVDDTCVHTFTTYRDELHYDDQIAYVSNYPTESINDVAASGHLMLFAVNQCTPNPVNKAHVRVQSVKIWEVSGVATNLVRDYVAATNANGIATLYDRVNSKFETVSGGGTFLATNGFDPDASQKADNTWTTLPAIAPLTLTAGTAPTTFVVGESLYGTPVATYTKASKLATLPAGVYTQTVSVAEGGLYRGISTDIVFTVTGVLPTQATIAPAIVAPAIGSTNATHTASQAAYLAKSEQERRAALLDTEYRFQLAHGGHYPQPVTLEWTGDGLCTVTVRRASDNKIVFTDTFVGFEADVDNLEIGTEYTWTVSNSMGSANGSFVTDPTGPRLLRDPSPNGVVNLRDLGGYIGIDGRRVKQGMIYRSAKLNIDDANRDFWQNTLGIKTEVDLRSPGDSGWYTSSPIGNGVTWVNARIGSYSGLFTSGNAFKNAINVFLDAANYPVDFHCSMGRDRTGVTAYILNAVLGVSKDELDKDWEANAFYDASAGFNHENDLDVFLTNLATYGGSSVNEQSYNFLVSLGYTAEQIGTFREIMLEPEGEEGEGEGEGPDVPETGIRTNAMANASWGYTIGGLGDNNDETAYIFTNTSSNAGMLWTVPWGVSTVQLLVVGGGGGGGNSNITGGGGGGAGGYMYAAAEPVTGDAVYSLTVGKGGAANTAGGASTFADYTVAGGGKGGSKSTGGNGASGGGGSGNTSTSSGSGARAGGTGSNGYNGGKGYGWKGKSGSGGGGGGATGAGSNAADEIGGNGGTGATCSITGAEYVYSSGGGGGADSAGDGSEIRVSAGLGATGAGNGGGQRVADGTAGVANGDDATQYGCGGGGAAGNWDATNSGGKGYQGVVIVRHAAPVLTKIAKPFANTVLSYENGNTVTAITNGIGYVVENGSASEIGRYTATVTPLNGYVWDDDGDHAPYNVEWEVRGLAELPMKNPEWGYCRVNLPDGQKMGDNQEIVLVFTNTAANMKWRVPKDVSQIQVLVAAGGGAGGKGRVSPYSLNEVTKLGGGGGGAGGFMYMTTNVVAGSKFNIKVGAGGVAGNGENSVFGDYTMIGGGKGGAAWMRKDDSPFLAANGNGSAGGSGGGGSGFRDTRGSGWYSYGGNGVQGYGYAGGRGNADGGWHHWYCTGGGGGGAGGAGANYTSDEEGGDGGAGVQCAITGENVWYCSGGAGSNGVTGHPIHNGGVGAGSGAYDDIGGDATGYGCGGGGGSGDLTGWPVECVNNEPVDSEFTRLENGGNRGGYGFQGVVIIRFNSKYWFRDEPTVFVVR